MRQQRGVVLLTTMMIMAVMMIMAFGATAGSLLQERMSANQRFKIMSDALAMQGAAEVQAWLQLSDEHWGEADEAWLTPRHVLITEGVAEGVIIVDPGQVVWDMHEMEMLISGRLQSLEGESWAETRLLIRFVRAQDEHPVALIGWSELP
ncbi:PilX N-terminal domain-containing pilus assembly protein [Nitrincola alkalilacustris]|uniref:PilX N-terminal domain-containing pilus assembly protein n=1 Tax=Nitrincola alkalilacustris TaxID=1571224 RepID=UPI00124F07A3|nr:PilX N-terminal domain-containing pilus assembly protein [Nitrincola alkalilacustris]